MKQGRRVLGNPPALESGNYFGVRLWSADAVRGWSSLENARPNLAATALETDLTALKQIGNCGNSFAAVFAAAADSQDQIPEAVLLRGAADFVLVFFHGGLLRLV